MQPLLFELLVFETENPLARMERIHVSEKPKQPFSISIQNGLADLLLSP